MDESGIYKPGTIIDGRYRVEKRLGRGGFATVYRAHHLKLDRPAALKVLEPVAPSISDRFLQRFTTEARIAANLEHPNVVRIFDYGVIEPDDRPYIAMEVLDGMDLQRFLIGEGPMEPSRAKRLFEGVLDALRIGHEKGIIHKDLKPANLFLVHPGTADERLVVLDFGIARLEGDDNPQLTEEGTYSGTPAYMAPEYIQRREAFPASDVYQIGLIFIELLTGQPVIAASTRIAYMVAHVEGKHRVPDDFGDTSLGATLLKSIAIDPSNRYANAGEMLEAVRIAEVTEETDFTLPAMTIEDDEVPRPERRDVPSGKSSRLPIVLAVGALLAVALCVVSTAAVGVGYFLYTDSEQSASNISADEPPPPAPEVPATPVKIPGMPGDVGDATEMHGWVLARFQIQTSLNLLRLFRESYERAGGWSEHPEWIATSDPSQNIELARQQIESSMKAAPRRVKLEQHAEELLVDLDALRKVMSELHDYHTVRRGWETDGGKRGERIYAELRSKRRPFAKSWEPFNRLVDAELEKFLSARQERYRSTDPYLLRATRAMAGAHAVVLTVSDRPGSPAASKALDRFDRVLEDLEGYTNDHGDELSERYEMTMGHHRRYVQILKSTRTQAGELRAAAKKGEDLSDRVFLRMELHGNLNAYNTLLRW